MNKLSLFIFCLYASLPQLMAYPEDVPLTIELIRAKFDSDENLFQSQLELLNDINDGSSTPPTIDTFSRDKMTRYGMTKTTNALEKDDEFEEFKRAQFNPKSEEFSVEDSEIAEANKEITIQDLSKNLFRRHALFKNRVVKRAKYMEDNLEKINSEADIVENLKKASEGSYSAEESLRIGNQINSTVASQLFKLRQDNAMSDYFDADDMLFQEMIKEDYFSYLNSQLVDAEQKLEAAQRAREVMAQQEQANSP